MECANLKASCPKKQYTYLKPSLEEEEYGTVMTVTHPFSNRNRFREPKAT